MNKERKNLIVFGYGLAVILTFFAARGIWKHGADFGTFIFIAAAIIFASVTTMNYEILKPFYIRWMKVAHFIGTVVTTLLLSIIYYVMFGAFGIVLRLLGKDFLDMKLEPSRTSYWIAKEQKDFKKEDFLRQF